MTCATEKCERSALFVVHWPRLEGDPPEMCLACTLRALRLADFMGFALSITPHPTLVPLPPAPHQLRCATCGELVGDCEHLKPTVRP